MEIMVTTESTDFITPYLDETYANALYNNEYVTFTIALILGILLSVGVYAILEKTLKFIFNNTIGKLLNKNDEINHKIDLK